MNLYYVYLDEKNFKFTFSIDNPKKSKIIITIIDDHNGALKMCEELDNYVNYVYKEKLPKFVNNSDRRMDYVLINYLDVRTPERRKKLFFYLKDTLRLSKINKIREILV